MQIIVFIFFLSCCLQFSYAQHTPFSLSESTDTSLSALFHNPAGIAQLHKTSMIVSHYNPFLLQAFQTQQIGIAIPLKQSVMGAQLSQFGDQYYKLQNYGLSYSRHFHFFSTGIRARYRYEFINNTKNNSDNFFIETSFIIPVLPQLYTGIRIINPGSTTTNEVPEQQIGLHYSPSLNCSISGQIQKRKQSPAIGQICIQYHYHKNAALQMAFTSGEQAYRFGNSYRYGNWQCQMNALYHLYIGFGFQYLLSYQLP